jgi:shikimate dehydrogenase
MSKTVGIIGHPLGHSISPVFQQAGLDHLGIDARYVAYPTPPEELPHRIDALRADDVMGVNVTVPHKEAVIPHLDSLSDEAQTIGAVNTIVNRNGVLEGHNTDVAGFLRGLREDGGFEASGRRALLLGAGGAARAVTYALMREGIGSMTIANRSMDRARELVRTLDGGSNTNIVSLESSSDLHNEWDLIVNCTIVGMRGGPEEGESPLPSGVITPDVLVCDLVYNPAFTPLLRSASDAGARTLSGLPMLVYQGAESFRLWTGLEAPVAFMMETAERALKDTQPS